MKQLIYSFDFDSTLADTESAHHIIDKVHRDKTDWVAYGNACAHPDIPEGPAAGLIRSVLAMQERLGAANYEDRSYLPVDFIVVSRRQHASYDLSLAWLNARGWVPAQMFLLGGPKSNNEMKQAAWKVRTIRDYEKETGNEVVLHVDDHPGVVKACQEAGIPALLVDPGYTGEFAYGKSAGI